MTTRLRFLCIGDIIGTPGMTMFQKWVPKLKEKYKAHAVIVNGENATKNAMGFTVKNIDDLKAAGADVITTGNHAFDQAEAYNALSERAYLIRPVNYPPGCPGKGLAFLNVEGHSVAVINVHGRVFVREMLDCPFRAMDSLLTYVSTKSKIILVDVHAEATSEKRCMGMFLDGRVSAVWGTHTHIQTADEYVMPQGTGYITDLGGCGALNSVLGMESDAMIKRLLIHHKMGKIAVEHKGPYVLSGILVEVDPSTGKSVAIERIRIVDDITFTP